MSDAKRNDPKDYPKPYLVLVATDKQQKELETLNKGVSEKQLLKLVAGDHSLCLRIDQQKLCPSEGHLIRNSKKEYVKESDKKYPIDVFRRRFDTGKPAEMEMILTPISQPEDGKPVFRSGKAMFKAIGDDKFPLVNWTLEAGKYKLELIGTIHFKYINHAGEFAISEEAQVDLIFMLEIEEDKNSPTEEDSDKSSPEAYLTEADLGR
ncbi:uncharacterized protein BHQ10_004412 [Talaromyces amestolkiae]|uniref:Uncharacterized protein n=1 Tax=Talaromyces amestolkiae TaxID=1196081 RepID=A0A364KXW7_TALAM|nr:uncharacterized protein BHQ10_004412 [Talaromyces amestolkiae]RAO68400.1 hypothetical protein BHQ10_004412 [Talaromyces amestolkiae]